MEILFTYYTIILYNFLEINIDIQDINNINNKNNTDSKNDNDISNYIKDNNNILKKARQAKKEWILY